jgi:bacteriorhodopsin
MEVSQFNLVYNMFSFAIAIFGASTVFFFAQRSLVAPVYRTALTLSGIVCLVALYHYVRIFDSFNQAYHLVNGVVEATDIPFNNAYRYVDWLLTVPLLLLELVLVMRLSKEETFSKGAKLAIAAAIMVILGYPGEIILDPAMFANRWLWWTFAMIPFVYIVWDLVSGLGASISKQPKAVKGLVSKARTLTIISWSFYPIVFVLPMLGLSVGVAVQVGYTIADILAKAVFGVMIYMIAQRKSDAGE